MSDDPDQYKGPGGLTAREIFQRVQAAETADRQFYKEKFQDQSAASLHEKQRPRPTEAERVKRGASANPASQGQYLSVKELKERLTELGVPHHDCLDKEALVERYSEAAIKYTAGLNSFQF